MHIRSAAGFGKEYRAPRHQEMHEAVGPRQMKSFVCERRQSFSGCRTSEVLEFGRSVTDEVNQKVCFPQNQMCALCA